MPCPMCREEFTIPDDGLSGMKKNFEKVKLIHFRKLQLMNMCEQHKDKQIEAYCRGCEVAVCVVCVNRSHKTHDWSYIENVSEELRKLVLSDKQKVSEQWKRTGEVLMCLENDTSRVIKYLAGVEDEIYTTADKLIAAIERGKVKLLSTVKSIKLKRVEQLETVKQDLEQYMIMLEDFTEYSETLLSSGTACDLTRSANSLHDTADELMKFDVIDHADSSLPPVNVTFTSSALLDRDDRNLVGTVTEKGQLEQISSSN